MANIYHMLYSKYNKHWYLKKQNKTRFWVIIFCYCLITLVIDKWIVIKKKLKPHLTPIPNIVPIPSSKAPTIICLLCLFLELYHCLFLYVCVYVFIEIGHCNVPPSSLTSTLVGLLTNSMSMSGLPWLSHSVEHTPLAHSHDWHIENTQEMMKDERER